MKEFIKTSLRLAAAFLLALVGLAITIEGYSWAKDYYDNQQAKPFEKVRDWEFSLAESIGIKTQAKTKLVNGSLLASIEVIGYSKFFSDPRNLNKSLIFEFLDNDGFKIISKPVEMSQFTTIIGNNGEKVGLSYQFDEYIGLDKYKRFSKMLVGWNLTTEPPQETAAHKQIIDHCAPGISKTERLKRLSQHGAVRETGTGDYSAGEHAVSFFAYDGSLIYCR